MKKILRKTKKNFLSKFSKYLPKIIWFIEDLIEHKLFKPVSIAIITSFLVFQGFSYVKTFVIDYSESKQREFFTTPVKINFVSGKFGLSFNDDQIIEKKIKSGDTLLKILIDIGVDEKNAFEILTSLKKVFDPSKIGLGDKVVIRYHVLISESDVTNNDIKKEVLIDKIDIYPDFESKVEVVRKGENEYKAELNVIKLEKTISRYHGTLRNGLYSDGVASGISPTSMMNMINLYSYEIDFQRDIHNGDKFEMLVESYYTKDRKKVKDGDVIFSSLTLKDRKIEIYRHEVGNQVEYFDAQGNSVRKTLLRTPINGARVSSGFGMRRHPILGYSKMHKGVDFAAPSGTPILAAGSGTIVHFGPKGAYGNYVQIKHTAEYSTAYGHASRFNKKFRVGAKVKQGEVVAYVGTTGRSTGPHLHFELLHKGTQVNPSKVKATSGIKLTGKEKAKFDAVKQQIDRYRKNIPNQFKG